MRWLSFLFVVLALICAQACQHQAKDDDVRTLSESFVHNSLAMSPITATASGYHVHEGQQLDEMLDDYSPAALERARAFAKETLSAVTKVSSEHVSSEGQADLDVIRLMAEQSLLDLDRIQSYRHNPTLYVEMIGNAVYTPFVEKYASEDKRMAQITARMEKIPAFLTIAKQNLVSAPEIWNQVAREEDAGNIDLIDKTIWPAIPAGLKSRYEAAAGKAIVALKAFDAFLKSDLSQHPFDWRLGTALYAEKFKLTLATGDQPVQALADAEAQLKRIREDMHRQAVAAYAKFFPGKTVPSDLNTVVSQVLGQIALQHAKPAQYFEEAKQDLTEATTFVDGQKLLTLPHRKNLEVIPTPEFMRGIYAVGGFSPAPVLEPELGAYYWITPFTPDMTPERVESKLREYNTYGLKILTIHEAMPGHYVQAEYASDIKPKWRGTLRGIFSNVPYVEGWAVYATEMMIDEGLAKSPEMQLTFGKQMLRVVANTILDIRLQTMAMTDQQAIDLMINDTFQEKEEAEKKLTRAKLSSCQLPAYFVGWRGWDRLRDEYQKKQSREFNLARFHERALKEGGVPLPVLTRLLLEQPLQLR